LATFEIFLKQRGECKTGPRPKILQFPDRRIGLVVVFSIDEKVAYTMLMEAKSPVRARDILKMPRDQIVR
jgi:hypothetical protein